MIDKDPLKIQKLLDQLKLMIDIMDQEPDYEDGPDPIKVLLIQSLGCIRRLTNGRDLRDVDSDPEGHARVDSRLPLVASKRVCGWLQEIEWTDGWSSPKFIHQVEKPKPYIEQVPHPEIVGKIFKQERLTPMTKMEGPQSYVDPEVKRDEAERWAFASTNNVEHTSLHKHWFRKGFTTGYQEGYQDGQEKLVVSVGTLRATDGTTYLVGVHRADKPFDPMTEEWFTVLQTSDRQAALDEAQEWALLLGARLEWPGLNQEDLKRG